MDRCLLLLSDVHDVGARRRVHVIVVIEIITIDTQQLHNSLGMLDDCLSDRGVGLSELLDQRLHKRRVLLHKFTELRDLRVGLQCAEIESWCGGSSTSTETGTRARASTGGLTLLLLLGELEEVLWRVGRGSGGRCSSGSRCAARRLGGRYWLCSASRAGSLGLKVCGNALRRGEK